MQIEKHLKLSDALVCVLCKCIRDDSLRGDYGSGRTFWLISKYVGGSSLKWAKGLSVPSLSCQYANCRWFVMNILLTIPNTAFELLKQLLCINANMYETCLLIFISNFAIFLLIYIDWGTLVRLWSSCIQRRRQPQQQRGWWWWKMEKIFTNEKYAVFFIISSATHTQYTHTRVWCNFSVIFRYIYDWCIYEMKPLFNIGYAFIFLVVHFWACVFDTHRG